MELTIAFHGDKLLYAQSPDPSAFFRTKGVACETVRSCEPSGDTYMYLTVVYWLLVTSVTIDVKSWENCGVQFFNTHVWAFTNSSQDQPGSTPMNEIERVWHPDAKWARLRSQTIFFCARPNPPILSITSSTSISLGPDSFSRLRGNII